MRYLKIIFPVFLACLMLEAFPARAAEDPAVALKTVVDGLTAAARDKKNDELKQIVARWTLPDANKWFRQHFGEEKGMKLAGGYAAWIKTLPEHPTGGTNRWPVPSLAGAATLRFPVKGGGETDGVALIEQLGKDRPPRDGAEKLLAQGAGDKPPLLAVTFIRKGRDNKDRPTSDLVYPTIYFIVENDACYSLGTLAFLNFPAAEGAPDPLANQKPTVESCQALMDAFDVACQTGNNKEVKRLSGQWDIPHSDEWFKKHWGDEMAAKLIKGYAACQKYRNFEAGEWSWYVALGYSERVTLLDPDKTKDTWQIAVSNALKGNTGPDNSPQIFIVDHPDPNTGMSRRGQNVFAFIDGGFREVGGFSYVVLEGGITKEEYPQLIKGLP